MSKKIAVIISPNWGDYAKKYLAECLSGLNSQDYLGELKLFLIDNESSPDSQAFLNKAVGKYWSRGDYCLLSNAKNDGFAKGNNDAMRVAVTEGYDYVALFNMDTEIDKSCLSNLAVAAETDKKVGAVQARLMLSPDKTKINSLGNKTHFLGFGYCEGYGQSFAKRETQSANYYDICYPSGAAVLLRASALKQVGLFDEEFWMYNEDQDLGWRLWLSGWRVILTTAAVVYHKYEFSRSIQKYYWMDRNRLIVIIKNYHSLTLVLILPALLMMEAGLFFFAIKGGWLKEKLKVYAYFARPDIWLYLIRARRRSQCLRKNRDRVIVKMFSGRIQYQEIDSLMLRLANVFFGLYWRLVKMLIWW